MGHSVCEGVKSFVQESAQGGGELEEGLVACMVGGGCSGLDYLCFILLAY